MTEATCIDILKKAILLEQRGRAFYASAAQQSSQPAVKEFFSQMADEEGRHIQILSDQFKALQANGRFAALSHEESHAFEVAARVLSTETQQRISAAGFEAAAISAAMLMEERAIQLYSERAKSAQDPAEGKLYRWLAAWEGDHLRLLADIDRKLTETIWNDNSYWPF
jgi:rubrerythrin